MGGALIEKRRLGRSGLELSRIGFGSAPMGDINRLPDEAGAHALLQAAWDGGIRYFDTAPMYGNGLAERRVGDFLRDKPRDDYVLSTKVGRLLVPDRASAMARYGNPRAMPFRVAFDYTYDAIMKSYEMSLQRLGLERIDILFLHDLGRFSQRERYEETLRQALDGGGVRALTTLREEGAVRAIGVGVNEWEILDLLMDHAPWDVFLLANRYTLLDQRVVDHFLPRCVREGVAIVDGAPLHSGLLVTGAVPGARYDYAPASEEILDKVRRIEAVCRQHGVPLVRAGLNFPLGHEAVASVIPGPITPAELADNLAHFRAAIPPGLWDDLKRAGLLHPDAPAPNTPVLA
ncbi:MAG TPA: aldo/keto reductase [Devosiaceae bacterium]|nr:aldo/keto reductase [Devosiaceae bacterium]